MTIPLPHWNWGDRFGPGGGRPSLQPVGKHATTLVTVWAITMVTGVAVPAAASRAPCGAGSRSTPLFIRAHRVTTVPSRANRNGRGRSARVVRKSVVNTVVNGPTPRSPLSAKAFGHVERRETHEFENTSLSPRK
jgi:hypothetical protein